MAAFLLLLAYTFNSMEDKNCEVKKILDSAMKHLTSKVLQHEIDKWPPECGLLAYQPKRPGFPLMNNSNQSGQKDYTK